MKELNKLSKPKIEEQVKKQQQIEKEFVDSLKPHKNHKVFEINPKDLSSIKEAEYINDKDAEPIYFGEQKPDEVRKEILYRDGFVYVSALNKKNALKKYKKGVNGSKKQSGFLEIDF